MNKFDLTPDNKHEYNTDLSATLTAAYRFNEHSDLQLTVYGDNYSKNNKLELFNGRKDLIYRHRIFQPRALYTVRVASKHFVNAGVEYLDETLYTDKFSSGSYETRRQQAVSVFVQDDWRISTHFSITGGIRSDYNNIYGYNLSPKVALLYKMFPFSFRFNYAAGYRSPSLKELYMNWDHFGMFWIYGNRNLRPEHNHYFSLSAEFVSERVYALSTGYINLFSNKIEGIWSANQTELHYRNISSATLAGINTNLRYNPFGKLFLHASANFLYPAKTGGVRLNTQSKLSGTMRAEYGLDLGRHHLAFNLSGTILGEKSYNVLKTIRINGTDTEAYYTAYVPAYSLWNAAATYRLSEQARLTVGINNLFNYSARIINFNTYTGVGRNLFAALALQL